MASLWSIWDVAPQHMFPSICPQFGSNKLIIILYRFDHFLCRQKLSIWLGENETGISFFIRKAEYILILISSFISPCMALPLLLTLLY